MATTSEARPAPQREGRPRADDGAATALELRPMTGWEEEVVERGGAGPNTARLCNEILARCLVPPRAEFVAALARVRALRVAERDVALVQLRRLSLGDHVELELRCPACDRTSTATFSLGALPLPAAGPGPAEVEVDLPEGRARLRVPTAGDQEELLDAGLETKSERKTFLLARTLLRLGAAEGPFEPDVVRGLPVASRDALEAALEAALPHLDLSMAARCPECGHGFAERLDVSAFFFSRWRGAVTG
jgi:hypothetical protein